MRYKQLLENPLFAPISSRDYWDSDDYIDISDIKHNFTYLCSVIVNNIEVKFFELNNKQQIIGCIKSIMPYENNKPGYHMIFILHVKKTNIKLPVEFNNDNIIQTIDVSTDRKFAFRGLTTFVYFNVLVDKLGYTVVCGDEHLFGGVKLWRKMSRVAMQYNKVIYLIKDGQYVLDKNNQPLVFDDTNFPKSKIWSTLPNESGKNVLFVIKNKE
jgi:hypothetical protein